MDQSVGSPWTRSIVGVRGPGARFSKVPKLFGRISGRIIFSVSSKRRGLEARNFAVILIYTPFTSYEKTSFTELAGRSFMNGFSGPKSFRDFRETGPRGQCFRVTPFHRTQAFSIAQIYVSLTQHFSSFSLGHQHRPKYQLTQCCTQFKPFGNKPFCFRNFYTI